MNNIRKMAIKQWLHVEIQRERDSRKKKITKQMKQNRSQRRLLK